MKICQIYSWRWDLTFFPGISISKLVQSRLFRHNSVREICKHLQLFSQKILCLTFSQKNIGRKSNGLLWNNCFHKKILCLSLEQVFSQKNIGRKIKWFILEQLFSQKILCLSLLQVFSQKKILAENQMVYSGAGIFTKNLGIKLNVLLWSKY